MAEFEGAANFGLRVPRPLYGRTVMRMIKAQALLDRIALVLLLYPNA